MTRAIEMDIAIGVTRSSYQQIVSVDLSNAPLADWCINLCLLKEQLIDELLFLGPTRLRLGLSNIGRTEARANIAVSSIEVFLTVNMDELEYWMSFFLKYYRDGVAEVDHIDVECMTEKREDTYVIFKVRDALAPISADEVRKIMRKYD